MTVTNRKLYRLAALIACALIVIACHQSSDRVAALRVRPLPADSPPALRQAVASALEQTKQTLYYDPAYVKIDYPGGDIPLERGACTDVIIRAFRKGGVDLQKEVHEDMERAFAAYPSKWGLKSPDTNIDHRRVPNLMTFFERRGKSLAVTDNAEEYLPGDVVTWDLGNGTTHIGMVSNVWTDKSARYMVVHNIGGGARLEDVLFAWRITGHYRYF